MNQNTIKVDAIAGLWMDCLVSESKYDWHEKNFNERKPTNSIWCVVVGNGLRVSAESSVWRSGDSLVSTESMVDA